MKNLKLIFRLFLLVFLVFNLWGCWNYIEINERAIGLSLAVDYLPDQELYLETVEIGTPVIIAEKSSMESAIFQETGKTVFDATRNLILTVGEKILWNHFRVVIVGEALLQEENKLIGLLDFLRRDNEPREDLLLVLSKEKTAAEILEKTHQNKGEKIVAIHLDNLFKNEKYLGKYKAVPLWEFAMKLATSGVQPVMPAVKLTTYQEKIMVIPSGMAVFRRAKVVGYLDDLETKYFLFVIDEIKGGVIPVQTEIQGETVRLTLEIMDSSTVIKAVKQAGVLVMQVKLKTTVSIAEIQTSINFIEPKLRKRLQEAAEATLERRIQLLIKKVQQQDQSDIFGFGMIVERQMPKLWQHLRANWTEIFTDLKVKVEVNLEIQGSATISKSLEVGE